MLIYILDGPLPIGRHFIIGLDQLYQIYFTSGDETAHYLNGLQILYNVSSIFPCMNESDTKKEFTELSIKDVSFKAPRDTSLNAEMYKKLFGKES